MLSTFSTIMVRINNFSFSHIIHIGREDVKAMKSAIVITINEPVMISEQTSESLFEEFQVSLIKVQKSACH